VKLQFSARVPAWPVMRWAIPLAERSKQLFHSISIPNSQSQNRR